MEACPYCKKPFKRLKSHLPHCKKKEPAGSEEQKPALLEGAKKTKRLTPEDEEPGTGLRGKHAEVTRDTRQTPSQPFPLQDVGVGSAGPTGAGGDVRSQIQASFQVPGVPEPKAALQKGSAPKAKPTEAPKSQHGRSEPAETETALFHRPVDPSLSAPEKTASSTLAQNIQDISAHFNVDKTDPPRQKFQGKASGIPSGGIPHSPTSLDHGGPSATGHPSKARASGSFSYVPLGVAGSENWAQAPAPPSLRLHMSPRDEKQGQEIPGPGPALSGGAQRDKGKARERVAVAGPVARVSTSGHPKKDLLGPGAPGLKSRDTGPSLRLPLGPARDAPCTELRADLQAPAPNLLALAVKFLPAEEAEACPPQGVPELRASPLSQHFGSRKPTLGAWPQATTLPGGLLARPSTPAKQGLVDPKPLAGSLGLQWLPELYPAYLGLGMFPGKLQYWDIVALKPQLIGPQGESCAQVPLLRRSWTRLWSPEPTSLTPSNLSLTSLLATVQRGWLRCGTCMRSGVGSVTMLFTGYFVLCCNWSFKHLKLQRWRK